MDSQQEEFQLDDESSSDLESRQEDEMAMRFGMSPRSESTAGTMRSGHLPTPLLETMARSDEVGSPWWRKFNAMMFSNRRGSSMMEEPLLPSRGDQEQQQQQQRQRQSQEEKKRWTWAQRCVFILPCTAVLSLLVFFLAMFTVVPSMAQTIVDETTLVPIKMHMFNPTNESITLNVSMELHDVGQISSIMYASDVEVYHDGYLLAAMQMPELDIVGGQPLPFEMQSALFVKNASAFTAATAKILQGEGGLWYIKGKPKVSVTLLGFKREFEVNMWKEMRIPATLLKDTRGYDAIVHENSATETSFNISAKTSFFSSSILELHNMGMFKFDFQVLTFPNGTLIKDYSIINDENVSYQVVKIGEVAVPNFDLRRNLNVLDSLARVEKTEANQHALSQFISNFMEGTDQPARIHGPTEASSSFLDDVVTQELTFEGLTEKPIDGSYINKETFNGYFVRLPGHIIPTQYRGTIVFAHNPLDAAVYQANLTTQIMLSEPLGYHFKNPFLGDWTCNKSSDFAELYAAPGMYVDDPKREPIVSIPAKSRVSFFLPGRPRKGQIKQPPCKIGPVPVAQDYDCCMVSIQIAASCRAKKNGFEFFDVDTINEFTLGMGPFELPVKLVQKRVPTVFAKELVDGFLLDAEIKCSEFEFFD